MHEEISPSLIYKYLERFVYKQEDAKRKVANTLFMHALGSVYKKVGHKLNKSNLLLMGPSGCGKTYMIELGCKMLGLPIIKINAKSITNTGYVGTSIETFFEEAYSSLPAAEREFFDYSVVFIDEIDKICGSQRSESDWYKQLQYSLLKLLEGYTMIKDRGGKGAVTFNTTNMLFVLAGNFEGIRDNRLRKTIGFKELHEKSELNWHQELLQFGVVKELVGRIGNVGELHELDADDFYKILTKKEDSIYQQYKALFEFIEYPIKIKDKDLKKICKTAQDMKIGVRGLQVALYEHISDHIYAIDRLPVEKFLTKETKIRVDPRTGVSLSFSYSSEDVETMEDYIKIKYDDKKDPIK